MIDKLNKTIYIPIIAPMSLARGVANKLYLHDILLTSVVACKLL